MKNTYNNPFSGVNAVQLNEDQIIEYWCNPFLYDLFSEIKQEDIFKDTNNIVLMGGRSTGKSMFLRYWSYPVQLEIAKRDKRTLKDIVEDNKGIGFYFRIDGAKLKSFQGYGFDSKYWSSIFTHYFELLVGRQYLEAIDHFELSEEIISKLHNNLSKLFNFTVDDKIFNISEIIQYLDRLIREVDMYLGTIPFYKVNFTPSKQGFISNSLSFGIAQIMLENIPSLKNSNIVILLDEYENFLECQQIIVNTMLRFSKSNIKFRIGMRLEGFRTFKMISDDDFIKEGREYRKVVFEEVINKNSGYHSFLEEICRKRLETIPELKEKGFTNIKEILGESENLEDEAISIIQNNPEKISDYFINKLHLSDKNLEKIKNPEYPLLELLNYIWIIRGNSIDVTAKAMNDYLQKNFDNKYAEKYRRDYIDKYKLSLTILLCSIYKKNKRYYSFNTFAFISSGIIGHFIELCRRTFAIAGWGDEEKLLYEGKIKIEHQDKAANDFSYSEKQQIIRIEKYGALISRFIENIGNVFRAYHTDCQIKYPETNQFAVNIDSIEDENMQKALREAIKWSIIQRKPRIQTSAPGESMQDIFTMNRILSPCFQITYRTRGGKSIKLTKEKLVKLFNRDEIKISDFLKLDTYNDKNKTQTLF